MNLILYIYIYKMFLTIHRFYPNAMAIAGLQHITNNLSSDSQKGMAGFKPFFTQLKNFEALLRVKERRTRFVHSCIRHTKYAHFEPLFENFSASLYEERWHEVTKFTRALLKLLGVMVLTWDEQKFNRGVDANGDLLRQKQENKQRLQDEGNQLHQFKPSKLTESLKSGKFLVYVHMALALDEVPSELASECELCVCHRALLEGLSLYERQMLMKSHYEEGVCLMSGRLMPELCCGMIEECIERVAKIKEQGLRSVTYAGAPAPTNAEWDEILADCLGRVWRMRVA